MKFLLMLPTLLAIGVAKPAAVDKASELPEIELRAQSKLPQNLEFRSLGNSTEEPAIQPRGQCRRYTVTIRSYNLPSQNYPDNYENNKDQSYCLVAASSNVISISCPAFDMQYHPSCDYDWLAVNGQKYCGTSGPFTSSTGSMVLTYHTDSSVVRSGFNCTIDVTAGGRWFTR